MRKDKKFAMKEVSVRYVFSGKFMVPVDTDDEAIEEVRKNCALNIGNLHATNPDISWEFGMTPDLEIVSVKDVEGTP